MRTVPTALAGMLCAGLPLLLLTSGATGAVGAAEPLVAVVDLEAVIDEIVSGAKAEPDLAIASQLLESEPGVTATVWVEEKSSQLTVGVSGPEELTQVLALFKERGLDAVGEIVERSQADLDLIVAEVYDYPGMEAVSSAMHDYARNRVVLTTAKAVTDELRRAAFKNFGM